jgi:HAD superfamily hydrolase (TIGR01490 family)
VTLALFDVDGTLLPLPSTEVRFVAWLARRRRLPWRALLRQAGALPRLLYRHGSAGFTENKAWLAGMEPGTLEALGEEFVRTNLARRLRPAVRARLDAHRHAGDRVLLLTGTPDFLARPLCKLLGADDFRATRQRVEGGRYAGQRPALHPRGAAKLEIARQVAAEAGSRLEDAVAYADAWPDRVLLEAVRTAVTVAPRGKLRRLALKRGWEILN